MDSVERLKVGIIGAGRIAPYHIRNLGTNSHAEIAAVCDVSEPGLAEIRETQAEYLGKAAFYSDYRTMLEQTKPDAVVICTPHHVHHPQMLDCLDFGAHVLIEKPLANTMREAEEIIARVHSSGKVAGVSYQRHMSPDARYVREMLAKAAFGRIQIIHGFQQENWIDTNRGKWRMVPSEGGGGYLHDAGSHMMDLVLWTTGLTPTSVSAFEDRMGTEVDVNSLVNLQFAGGTLASTTIIGSCGEGFRQIATIICDHANIRLDGREGMSIKLRDGQDITPLANDRPVAGNIGTNFVNAILGIEPIAVTVEWAAKVMRVIDTAYQSAELGGTPVLF